MGWDELTRGKMTKSTATENSGIEEGVIIRVFFNE